MKYLLLLEPDEPWKEIGKALSNMYKDHPNMVTYGVPGLAQQII